ncbi:hypothetical protein D3C78_772430 [compost metagenome]
MQRQGVGHATNVAGHHRHRAKLAHGPRGAQHHAVDQAPFDVRQGHVPEHLPAVGTEQARSLFFLGALLLHQRDQLTGNEGHGDEDGRQHDARQSEDDLDIVVLQPRPEKALGAEHQHVDQAGDHRRYRERQVDQGDQDALATEGVLAHAPGGADAEYQVQRHRDDDGEQRQLQRRQGIRLEDRLEEGTETVLQRLRYHDHQRQQQKQCEHQPAKADQDAPRRGAAATCGIGGGVSAQG